MGWSEVVWVALVGAVSLYLAHAGLPYLIDASGRIALRRAFRDPSYRAWVDQQPDRSRIEESDLRLRKDLAYFARHQDFDTTPLLVGGTGIGAGVLAKAVGAPLALAVAVALAVMLLGLMLLAVLAWRFRSADQQRETKDQTRQVPDLVISTNPRSFPSRTNVAYTSNLHRPVFVENRSPTRVDAVPSLIVQEFKEWSAKVDNLDDEELKRLIAQEYRERDAYKAAHPDTETYWHPVASEKTIPAFDPDLLLNHLRLYGLSPHQRDRLITAVFLTDYSHFRPATPAVGEDEEEGRTPWDFVDEANVDEPREAGQATGRRDGDADQ